MPRRLSIQFGVVETVLFVGLFALAGHLSLNFWEKYVIQSEITNMKTSLHSLKDTITDIGNAYDNLQNELKVIVAKAEMKSATVSGNHKDLHCCKNKHQLDSTLYQDHLIPTVLRLNKTDNFKWSESAGKNATTTTKYPPKSTGVGSDVIKKQGLCNLVTCRDTVQTDDSGHHSFDDYEYCCRHTCKNVNHIGVH